MLAVSKLLRCLLILAFLMLSAGSVQTAKAAVSETLYVNLIEPGVIDPTYLSTTIEYQVGFQIFAGLTKINDRTGEAEPDLASGWTWNAAGDEVTFTLKPGLKWSDGQPLTSADARYALLRSIKADSATSTLLDPILNAAEYRDGTVTDPNQVGVYVDSPTQVRIKLDYPMAFFEKVIANPVAYPLPQHVIEAHPDDWTEPQYIVCSGPYKLTVWEHEARMHFVSNPNYNGVPAVIPEVEVALNLSDDSAWDAYLGGSLDTIDIPFSKIGVVQGDPLIKEGIISVQDYCSWTLKFNVDNAPFNNMNVRKAFIAAINRQQIVDDVLAGAAIPTQTFIPPGIFGYVDGAKAGVGIPFSAAQAQQYLTLAGYPGGAGLPQVSVQVRESPRNRALWDYLDAQWKSVLNVDVAITYSQDPQPVQNINWNGWCADYNEGYNYVNDAVVYEKAQGRLGSWNNSTYNALMLQIAQTTNPADRLPLYQQAEEMITETDAVYAPLYVTVTKNLTHDHLLRNYSNFTGKPWHLWSITRKETASYTPSQALTFAPTVGNTAYALPAGAFAEPMTLTHTVLRPSEAPAPQPTGTAGIGELFRLDATAPGSHSPGLDLAQTNAPYTITVRYSEEQLRSADVGSEASLAVYAAVNGTWVKQASVVSTAKNQVTATTRQVSTSFVVLGELNNHVFLPAVMGK